MTFLKHAWLACLPVILVSSVAVAQTDVKPPEGAPQPTVPPAPEKVDVTAKWSTSVYGFVEVDFMHDSTQSLTDGMNNTVLLRPDVPGGRRGQTQGTIRNSRFGFSISAPAFHGIVASGLLEGDFFGNQPSHVSEASFFTSPTFRLRHAYLKLASEWVDLLAGQTYTVFGGGAQFFPATDAFLPIPVQSFARTPQLRLSHAFGLGPIAVEPIAAVFRPPQGSAETPDLQGAVQLSIPGWKGIHTPGSANTTIDAAAINVSGVRRSFRLSFADTPTVQRKVDGSGFAVAAFVPIIPAEHAQDRANAFTVTGMYLKGYGIADLLGGLTANAQNPGTFDLVTPIDDGLVTYDAWGKLHTIEWQAYTVGGQYYLPPTGNVFVTANYTQAKSTNIDRWAEYTALPLMVKEVRYFDANVFADVTPSTRLALSYQSVQQTFADGVKSTDDRFELSGFLFF